MAPTRVILMSCGSYNPPTDMHLRMFELARDHLHRMGTHTVVGAVISPTHDEYAKKELVSAEHRCAMLKLATQNSDWIRVSTWETRQNGWTKTRLCLQHHQNLLNSLLLDTNDIKHCVDIEDMDWIPEKVKNSTDTTPIQIKLLCGGDLLESFGTPGLWADEDIDAIVGQHGLVVITREGSNPHKFIYESDILSKYMHNIHIVINWIRHEVSSTKIRKAFRRGDSVKYEVQDSVIEYVHKHGLYGVKTVSTIKLELSSKNGNDYLNIQPKYQSAFLTPSPSDITMTTPSPVEIISIDFSESVLKKNLQNSPSFSKSRTSTVDETERMREKFINVISENGNKLLASNKAAYPGQAKQIIATETGESQIFCEVGLSCISEKYKSEMGIDGGGGEQRIADNIVLDIPCKVDSSGEVAFETEKVTISNEPSPSEALETFRSSEQTISPDDSESKVSVVLAMDVTDAPSIDSHIETVEPLLLHCADERQTNLETTNGFEPKENESNTDKEHESSNVPKSSISEHNDDFNTPANLKKRDSDSEDVEGEKPLAEFKQGDEISITKSDELTIESVKHSIQCQHKHEIIIQLKGKVSESIPLPTTIEESPVENVELDEKSNSPTNEADRSGSESTAEGELPKRETNIEIDGKYIKSLVNSRKSPKKVKDNVEKEEIVATSTLSISESGDSFNKPDQSENEAEPNKSPYDTPPSSADLKAVEDAISETPNRSSVKTVGRKRGVLFQGSLDSINVTQAKLSTTANSHKAISKKSKSYEFIKPTDIQPTTVYKISSTDLKSDPDSTSVFVTANEGKDPQTDEFCSVCCYANDPSSTEVFFTLRSSASSPLEEDSTECDICSNCDLQENGEEADFKATVPAVPGEPVCELCEICGDRALDEDVVASSRPEKDDFIDRRLASRPLPLSLPKKKKGVVRLDSRTFENIDNDDDEDNFEVEDRAVRKRPTEKRDNVKVRSESIDEQSTDNTNSNDDEFEIENCGLDLDLDFEALAAKNSRYESEVEDTFKNFLPRDEVAMSGKSANKMTRAGSLVTRDTVDRSKAKRRYSSVDNLQNSRQVVKSTPEKQNSLRSRGAVKGLVASADNIRPIRSSRSRSLRKSADDVGRGYNSSVDDTRDAPLYENIQRKKFDEKGYGKTCMPTVRQIVDCLVAARPMPIRCGSCLNAKHTINHATNSRSSNVSNCVSGTTNDNANVFGNLKNLNANDNTVMTFASTYSNTSSNNLRNAEY